MTKQFKEKQVYLHVNTLTQLQNSEEEMYSKPL